MPAGSYLRLTMPVSTILEIALLMYVLANGFAFLLYAVDKRKSERDGARRIPEKTLLGAAAVGPFGACAAMRLFRHKTKKPLFFLVFVFLVLHIAILIRIFLVLPA